MKTAQVVPPELDDRTLLLKIPHPLVEGHEKNEVDKTQ